MKKIFMFLALFVSVSATSQIQKEWLTNHKEATSVAETSDLNILVFAYSTINSERYKLLETELFNSDDFKNLSSSLVFLKLDLGADDYNKRLAMHYTGVKSSPAIALIDNKGNRIGTSLTEINAENIRKFISFLKENH